MKTSTELLRDTLTEWASLYGRRLKEDEISAWMRIFARTNPKVLAFAVEHVTRNSERMPTPGNLTKAVIITYEQHPELARTEKLVGFEGKDKNGVPCLFWSDETMVPAYRAKDCPEGLAFLKKLAEVAGRQFGA